MANKRPASSKPDDPKPETINKPFVKVYLPQRDVNRIKREAKKRRISASTYAGQIVLDHLASMKETTQESR